MQALNPGNIFQLSPAAVLTYSAGLVLTSR